MTLNSALRRFVQSPREPGVLDDGSADPHLPSPIRVLLVEDDPDYAESLRDLLEVDRSATFAVTHVSTLAGALEQIRNGLADAIVLDLSLPDAAGHSTVRRIQLSAPELPIVVSSGTEDDDLAMRAVASGAQDFLVKGRTDLHQLSRSIRYAILRKRAEERLRSLAQHDSLTGLANRLLFEDRLEQALTRAARKRARVAVMLLDVDRFKQINDGLGHLLGDSLLRAVARRLLGCVRESDTVARHGGDEFTVILEGVEQDIDVKNVAEKIILSFHQPFTLESNVVHTTASLGIAIYPDHGIEPNDLLRHADAAMYLAKERGRNGYAQYAAEDVPAGEDPDAVPDSTTRKV